MLPYQERVIEERAQVFERFKRLEDFINSEAALSVPDRELLGLVTQHGIMAQYVRILDARIAEFPKECTHGEGSRRRRAPRFSNG